jgi:hypothetical protein
MKLLRLLAQHEAIDTEDVRHTLALPGADTGSQSEQLRGQCQPAELRTPPPLGGADMLAVPCSAVGRILGGPEERRLESLGSITATDRASVGRHGDDGDTTVRDMSRRIERESPPVGTTPHDGQRETRARRTLTPVVDTELAGTLILARTHALGGNLRLENTVRPSPV